MIVLDDILTGVLTGVVAGAVIAAIGFALRWYWDYYRPLRVVEWDLPERAELGDVLTPGGAPVPVRLLTIRARNRSSGPIHLRASSIGLRGSLAGEPTLSVATDVGGEDLTRLTIPAREFRTVFVYAPVARNVSIRVCVWLSALGYKRRVVRGWILEVNTFGEPTVRTDVPRGEERKLE